MDFNIINGFMNFLELIDENWTLIVVIVGLCLSVAQKIREYLAKTNEEKIDIAKRQIKETMLKLITDAEVDYLKWVSAGSIKRSQVIEKVYAMYPVLSKVADQDELIQWIDDVIDESLAVMRKIFEDNAEDNAEDVKKE